jgi:hypothetical protein
MRTRFRASIYLDIFVEGDKSLEQAREEATAEVQSIVHELSQPTVDGPLEHLNYSNPYLGGVAHYTPNNLLVPFDRDI